MSDGVDSGNQYETELIEVVDISWDVLGDIVLDVVLNMALFVKVVLVAGGAHNASIYQDSTRD